MLIILKLRISINYRKLNQPKLQPKLILKSLPFLILVVALTTQTNLLPNFEAIKYLIYILYKQLIVKKDQYLVQNSPLGFVRLRTRPLQLRLRLGLRPASRIIFGRYLYLINLLTNSVATRFCYFRPSLPSTLREKQNFLSLVGKTLITTNIFDILYVNTITNLLDIKDFDTSPLILLYVFKSIVKANSTQPIINSIGKSF